jgi:hypothetical protein
MNSGQGVSGTPQGYVCVGRQATLPFELASRCTVGGVEVVYSVGNGVASM